MEEEEQARILCVDDEQNVLDGMENHLAMHYEVVVTTSGQEALEIMGNESPFDVIISDMRMPEMNGAEFLKRARLLAPDSVRMLLTGQSDQESAIAAINEGQIFRFLTKPCSAESLLANIEAGVSQHRLVTAERVLLEGTLRGAVKTMTDILAYSNAPAFGRAARVTRYVKELSAALKMESSWQIEVAAMMSQLICLTLPSNTVEALYYAPNPTKQQQAIAERLPALSTQLLGDIPRLDEVRDIIRNQNRKFGSESDSRPVIGARLLKVALDFDALDSQGKSMDAAIETMHSRTDWYDPDVLEAFCSLREADRTNCQEVRIQTQDLQEGMILAEDLKDSHGKMAVSRGIELSEWLLNKAHMCLKGHVGPISIIEQRSVQPPVATTQSTADPELAETSPKKPTRSVDALVAGLLRGISTGDSEIALGNTMLGELVSLQRDPELDGLAVVRLVETNPDLAVEILRVANTSAYQRREPATNLRDAILRLGNQTVLSVAQAQVHRGFFEAKNPHFKKLLGALWEETKFVSLLAREIAGSRGDVNSEESFLVGLLHNAGEVAILRCVEAASDSGAEPTAERLEQIGQSYRKYHERVAEKLLKKWQVPAMCMRIAGQHHDVATRPGMPPLKSEECEIVQLLSAASYIAESEGYSNPLRSHYSTMTREETFKVLELSEEEILELVEQTKAML